MGKSHKHQSGGTPDLSNQTYGSGYGSESYGSAYGSESTLDNSFLLDSEHSEEVDLTGASMLQSSETAYGWNQYAQSQSQSAVFSITESESYMRSLSLTHESEVERRAEAQRKAERKAEEERLTLARARLEYEEHLKSLEQVQEQVGSVPGYGNEKVFSEPGYGQSEGDDFSISFSQNVSQTISESELKFTDEEALEWYRGKYDPVVKNQRKNVLMGWKKGEDGKWTQGGEAPTAMPSPKGMKEAYKSEQLDAESFRGSAGTWKRDAVTPNATVAGINTHYLSPKEQREAVVRMQGGKLVDYDNKGVDTTSSTGVGTQFRGGSERFVFNKDVDGTLRALDPWEHHKETQRDEWLEQQGLEPRVKDPNKRDLDEIQMSFLNHSSLNRGGESRGAGELLVEDGDVKMVNDSSGHYQPDGGMMYDVVQGLVDDGAKTEGMSVSFVNKDDKDKHARLKAFRETGGIHKGRGARFGDLIVGANEFLSYGGDVDAEKKMRQAREDRTPLLGQIESFLPGMLRPVDQSKVKDHSAPVLQAEGEDKLLLDQEGAKAKAEMPQEGSVKSLIDRWQSMGRT